LHLKSQHFEANINGISAEEFPTIPLLPKDLVCSIKKDDLIDAIKKVSISPANDETRPVLAGIYFNFEDKVLTLAATDSYRLSEKKLNLEEALPDRKFIVPSRTMLEVLRIASGDDAGSIAISSTENQILFKIGETQVISRLIEGAFPNYSQIIPAKSKIKAVVVYSELLSAIKMAALFAKNSANNVKIKTDGQGLAISSMANEAGDTVSKIAAEVTGGEIEIAYNVRYVLDVLQVIQSDKVILEFNDDASAGLIKTSKDKGFIYIVMPLKIDS
jgi:DNA polymerase-3 subunit beta